MITDRELLELAARAAGVRLIDRAMGGSGSIVDGAKYWDPLTDDGAALRLAVRLNLAVHKGFVYTPTGALFDHRDYANPLAATRRAIVRAAAEIGLRMKDKEKSC